MNIERVGKTNDLYHIVVVKKSFWKSIFNPTQARSMLTTILRMGKSGIKILRR